MSVAALSSGSVADAEMRIFSLGGRQFSEEKYNLLRRFVDQAQTAVDKSRLHLKEAEAQGRVMLGCTIYSPVKCGRVDKLSPVWTSTPLETLERELATSRVAEAEKTAKQ